MKEIILAETAGFCFGVDRAVQTVQELLKEGKKVATLGPIIHNPQLVAELQAKGARIVDEPEQVKEDEVLVIRSHGVTKERKKSALRLVMQPARLFPKFIK